MSGLAGRLGIAVERRRTRESLSRARRMAEEVHSELAAVRSVLLRLQADVASAPGPATLQQAGRLYPPPPDHVFKEEAEALRLMSDILSSRLDRVGNEVSVAS